MLISHWILILMKSISYKIVEKIKKTHFMLSASPPADHITLVWPAKLCDGIKLYRRVQFSFIKIIGKITVCKNKQKIIKVSSLKHTNRTTLCTSQCQGVGETQQVWLAQFQTHKWKNFQLLPSAEGSNWLTMGIGQWGNFTTFSLLQILSLCV